MKQVENQTEFAEAIKGERTVVMFSADWCPDCRVIEPVLPKIEADYPEIDFIHADRDKLIEVCQKHDVFGIPSFIGFKYGEEVDRFVSKDRKTEEEITEFLDRYLEK